ncbi:hypothetical protein MUP38_02650 [Candidatus Bathyarchaeota archaeon]|nr:hypothetical protein [Candidatus Bathyarchaeota archaeon]
MLTIKKMTHNNLRDLELVRHLLKQINDYSISLSSEEKTQKLFETAVESTHNDWVTCQQFSKYLLRSGEYALALAWADRALEKNLGNAALQHHKGNVLRRWGMDLKEKGKDAESDAKFHDARKYFTLSRTATMPSEYGYVTHLDMLLYLIQNAKNDLEKANLIAEGAQLYEEAIKVIPQTAYNFLLESRFFVFDLHGNTINDLCKKIEVAVDEGRASIYGAAFLADSLYRNGNTKRAIEIIREQRKHSEEGLLLWVKEAELNAREGNFSEASKCIHLAKMREKNSETAEVQWRLHYWDLIISFVLGDYKDAMDASGILNALSFMPPQVLPRGYIWKDATKNVRRDLRKFPDHAKIWTGKIENVRTTGGGYGRIEVTNIAGEKFFVAFNPKYFWQRRDFRPGEYLKFVIAIHSNGLRAQNIEMNPFVNTTDDVFVKV